MPSKLKPTILHALYLQLLDHEGKIPFAYQDSLGYWTIGIGHLIDKRKGGKISEAAIRFLFEEDVYNCIVSLDQYLPWWKTLSEVRQRVLLDMCFNLGIAGLLTFKNTLAMIHHGDYAGAAENMLLSKWARQVGRRARRLSRMMAEDSDVTLEEIP
jgi:lysozyme